MFCNVNAQPLQASGHVAPGPLAVVGQEEERSIRLEQSIHETIRPGDQLASPVDHAIHVDQVSNHRDANPRTSVAFKTS